mmetsp:Transcript_45313/g.107464  ORF Transcript_45313/g.107464 Transcript_45313/m.107464 type:complete len:200 (-) Transcript_45313:1448-2047(-)
MPWSVAVLSSFFITFWKKLLRCARSVMSAYSAMASRTCSRSNTLTVDAALNRIGRKFFAKPARHELPFFASSSDMPPRRAAASSSPIISVSPSELLAARQLFTAFARAEQQKPRRSGSCSMVTPRRLAREGKAVARSVQSRQKEGSSDQIWWWSIMTFLASTGRLSFSAASACCWRRSARGRSCWAKKASEAPRTCFFR